MKFLRLFTTLVVLVFAIIGLVFTVVFVSMKFGLLNVRGTIEDRNNSILLPNTTFSDLSANAASTLTQGKSRNWWR